MSEHNHTGLDEAASVASNTMQAVRTGKAISAAAKGAAAGGPYGAAIGAALSARKHIGKIAVAALVLLALPLLFILLLPGIIFGSLTDSGVSGAAGQPILNDNAAITENMNQAAFAINQILGEGIENVQERIANDFAGTGGDHYEVVNPYEGDLISNANLFISQYCAAKELDFDSISLTDMEQILRAGLTHLYSFSRTMEVRTVPAEEDGEEDTAETWYIYTIRYNGEAYFADTIFALTDEQKGLAENYAENLSLFLGDGLFQYAPSTNTITTLGDVRFTDGETEVIYFNQLDERYANQPYGTDHIGGYGCGPTSMAIVVSSLTSETVDPVQMARWAYEHGYWCSKSGSYHTLIPGAAQAWGLSVEGCTASEPQRILDALADGKLVVALMTKGHFTKSGHFIVLRGIQGEKILLSVGRRPVTKGFGLETLAPEPFRNGIKVNGFMQTSVPNVYACGDITAFSLLAHTAVSEAEVAVDHILGKNRSMSYKAIPGVVYTNPEIAGVGKTEEELQAEGTPYTVKKIPMAFSGRFVAENEQGNGVCKLILAEDETIIGAHLLGNPASELIVIAGIAVEKGMKASELKSIVFPHPTVGEILKEAL